MAFVHTWESIGLGASNYIYTSAALTERQNRESNCAPLGTLGDLHPSCGRT